MNTPTLSEEEICWIAELIDEGKTIREISFITGRSSTTIQRVKSNLNGIVKDYIRSQSDESAKWLRKNWHWKKPKDQVIKKKKSHFMTPYKNCRPY